ncbi:MAG: TlpA family protein disulfide reductase [Rubrivivax sp.]|nr:TlpA family protein disulfide reductase [Rubrivivax sp.]
MWMPLLTPLAMAGLLLIVSAAAQARLTLGDMPDFTLRQLNGPNLRLQEQRGQVVMVNFWATWCGPCRQELPHLNRLQQTYARSGFVMLGVNVDDDPGKATALATQLGLRFPVLFDTSKRVIGQWNLSAMPSTVLIDRQGRVRHLHRGYRQGLEQTYDEQIRGLLKE